MALIITDNSKKLMQSWRGDWNKAAREMFRVRLDNFQEEGIHLIQHNKRTSFCSATSMGKDFMIALASELFLLLVPGFDENGIFQTATVINTAPTDRQVKKIMLPELKSRYNGSIIPELQKHGLYNFTINNDGFKFTIPKHLKGNPKYANYDKWALSAFKADEYNTEAWTGFHNENIMVAVTEASGMPQLIWDGIEGCLQNNSRLVLAHNANSANGEAYNSMKDPQYASRRITAFDSGTYKLGKLFKEGKITKQEYQKGRIQGQLDYEWVYDHIHKQGWTIKIHKEEKDLSKHDFEFEGEWYRPSDVCKIKILAQHPENTDTGLIPLSWIEAAQQRWLEARRPEGKGIRGVDVSGMGVDTTVFCDRFGDYVDNFQTVPYMDKNTVHMETAGRLMIDKDNFDYILIDAIGEGAGTFSRIKEQGVRNCLAFKNSYSARNLTDKTGTRKFVNMRSYTHWAMRDWLDPQFDSNAMLPPDDELKAQLCEIKYVIKSDGSIIIEPKEDLKKRLGVSPDKSDTLAETFAPIDRLSDDSESDEPIVTGGRIMY